ncbi:hypothetical protein [Williamsia sp. DF01-3]|uniref:hypothetical protein n=1 Tax=Williamsia sp. DF01-3 TaxID=2934157 RepID=UPI001FF1FCA3|nr:hypothetical protein [Williamsia sp. DF01-3]MCK0515685.1 hypothetical protein [Williamsia sp. DF01-3]
MVALAPHTHYRVSKRGLVLACPNGDTVLFEHPRAADLPVLLATNPDPSHLTTALGPPLDPTVVDDLVELGVLTNGDDDPGTNHSSSPARERRFTVSRSGLMIKGIATPSAWLNRRLVPLLTHPLGLIVIAAVLAAGGIALLCGRPDGLPRVSDSPATEALLMIALGMTATIAHEFAHAVALSHYGRAPRRAGFGFYWGALSFFVDSTPALTLPRHQRVVQALIGLVVDVVTTALFAIAAHLVQDPLLAIVFWRLAILGLVDIGINALPVLQVDGHWALADLLDEPDLGPRARRALAHTIRRQLPAGQRALAAYGAISLAVGLTMIATLAYAFWATTGDLVIALFNGNPAQIAIGLYYVGPLALGLIFSTLGLLLESTTSNTHTTPNRTETTPPCTPTDRTHQPQKDSS